MSRADDYLAALYANTHATFPKPVYDLLRAVAEAWQQADAGIPSEAEANRWSPVCSAAERVVGL